MKWAGEYTQIPHEFYGTKWPTLEEAWDHFYSNVPYRQEHRAYYDAAHEAAVLWAILQKERERKR